MPYRVKCVAQGYNVDDFSDPVIPKKLELVGIIDCKWCEIYEIKRTVTEQCPFEETYLLLRPLSDLAKGDTFKHLYILIGGGYKNYAAFKDSQLDNYLYTPPEMWSYMAFELFLSLHIDVFGLLDKNLAINLNEVK